MIAYITVRLKAETHETTSWLNKPSKWNNQTFQAKVTSRWVINEESTPFLYFLVKNISPKNYEDWQIRQEEQMD